MPRKRSVPASAYWEELWTHKRLLLAGTIGIGVGYGFSPYVFSIMAPRLIAEFHWPRAEFTAINALMLIHVLIFPLVGRLNDLIGVRRTALIGVVAMPMAYLSYSMLTGDLRTYAGLYLLQGILCLTTTAITYTRLIVHHFDRARGFALAIVASGTALFGIFCAPLLNNFVETHGWRNGYILAAAISGGLGLLALSQLPGQKRGGAAPPLARMADTKSDYAGIFRNKTFWTLVGAILLCNLPTTVALAQLTLLLIENGISPGHASGMLAAYAVGTLIGRLTCGLAIDRLPMNIVSAIGMGLPALGMALFASPFDTPLVLTTAVLLMGLSNGAEADLLGYIIANKFGTRVYSSVSGLTSGAMSVASATGAILLSVTLAATNSFSLFLIIAAICAALGATLLLTLKKAEQPASAETGTSRATV